MKWEDSKADKALDKREAKKRKMPVSKWEGSAADDRMDKAVEKKIKKKKRK